MSEAEQAPEPGTEEDRKTEQSLEAFRKLTDPKERKRFYDAHPELARVFSPVNFHSV